MKEVRQALYQPKAKDCFGVANVNHRIQAFYGHDSGIDFNSKMGQYTLCTMILYVDQQENRLTAAAAMAAERSDG